MAKFKNYYQILEVEAFADVEAVKSAFRKLARQYHPDLNSGNRAAEEKFKEINEAYETLSNPDKRQLYDESFKVIQLKATPKGTSATSPKTAKAAYGADKKAAPNAKTTGGASQSRPKAEDGKPTQNTTPINELFETFLKKGFKADAPREEEGIFRTRETRGDGKEKPRRGEDVIVQTVISPLEAEQGVVKTVNVQHNEICKRCSATGKISGAVCPGCNGEKILVRLKKIDVRIPAGVKQGSRVRVAKEGGRGQGGAENGDLFLQIEIAYDPSLRIEGLDVYGEMPISVTDAVLGGEVEVPTLLGPVKMSIPAGTVSGKTFRLKERGAQNGQNRGDHYVTVKIVPPENLTSRERELYEELARLRPEKPTPKKSK